MRTAEEIQSDYTKLCAEVGDLEWQKMARLARMEELDQELTELRQSLKGPAHD